MLEVKKEIAELEETSPMERIYPLNFVCEYVMRKKDELTELESQSIQDILEILKASERIQEYTRGMQEADGMGEEHQRLYAMQKELHEKIRTLSIQMTEKGFVFENMNNMLQQTGPLISRLIFQDNLTAAYNRYFFISHVGAMFKRAQKHYGLSMAFIDIDNFKQFNTEYGHEFGDQVLQWFGKTVDKIIHSHSNMYLIRMGGDEFVVLNHGSMGYAAFIRLLEELRIAVGSMVMQQKKKDCSISISIGAANAREDGLADAWDLYRLADERLYRAKGAGKNVLITAD